MTDATSSIPPTYIIGGISFAVLAGLTYFFLGNNNTESSKPISQKDLDELVSSSHEEKKRRNQKKKSTPSQKEENKQVEVAKKEEKKKEEPKKEEAKKEGKKKNKKKGNQQQKKDQVKPLDLLANKLTGDDDEGEWEEVGKKDTDKKKSYQDTQKKTKELYISYLENF